MLIVIVVITGVVIIRLSQAGSVETFSIANVNVGGIGQVITVTPGSIDQQYANGQPKTFDMSPGGRVESTEGASMFLQPGQHGRIRACWYFYSTNSNTKEYSVEVNGELFANNTINSPGSRYYCVDKDVNYDQGNMHYQMIVQPNSNGNIAFSKMTRELLTASNANSGTPIGNTSQLQTLSCGQSATAPCTFTNPSGGTTTITSLCGYTAVGPYASLCPGNINQWAYVGFTSSFVGTKAQNQARGVTNEMDAGYWTYGGLCGVKSHVVSDPILNKVSEANGVVHFYLVGCPSTQDVYSYKLQNRVTQEAARPTPKGRIYITKYGPNGPVPPNGNLKSNPSTVPGNTNVCTKNKSGQTFACSAQNSINLDGILVNDSPYNSYFSVPTGWKVTRVLVNNEPRGADNGVSYNVRENQTSYVDIYFDRK